MSNAVLPLAVQLIERPSVTPDDAGCQDLIAERLAPLQFVIERMNFAEVKNLWARRGTAEPLLVFLGHTDVVPSGPPSAWTSPPFGAGQRDGYLYGRGASDMKGNIASFVVALERWLPKHPSHKGSIALLLTSDEEGPSIDGTIKVVQALQTRGEKIDYCLVGEPSSSEVPGDIVKVGRRGSLGGRLVVEGVQGHVAYPHLALNPIHSLAPALAELCARNWDEGNQFFPATTFQVSNINAGTGADNVIPGTLEALINFRFSTESTADDLQKIVESTLTKYGVKYKVTWRVSGQPFLTGSGPLVDAVCAAIEKVIGKSPELSTAGGTSDGRFVAPTGAQVVEVGLVNKTIHKIDECVRIDDLETLSRIYEGIMDKLLL